MNGRLVICSLALVCLAHSPARSAETAAKPNIVFILADDLGWANVGVHGSNVPTPNLDRLARDGVELTHHYVYPVCSPTRAAFLSGRYATRFGVTSPQNERAYPFDTVTLPRALKTVGYDTALVGKWHLGSKPEWGPNLFGFDHAYGSLAGGVGPWNHRYKLGPFTQTWHRDGKLIEEEGHVTDLIATDAARWIESRGGGPFFLYVPFTAVHIPIREPEAVVRRVPADIAEASKREFAASVIHLDDAVGQILAALDAKGVSDNTLVVFASDNGGTPKAENNDAKYPPDNYAPGPAGGDNRPLRGEKGTVYEGGIRTPALVRWPAKLKAGRCEALLHVTDWMPTFCSLAGYKPQQDLRWDGRDAWPVLSGVESAEPRAIYTAAPGFRARAIRDGDWKLIVSKFAKDDAETYELFNLAKDPNETTDLAASMPDRVAQLRAKLEEIARADRDSEVKE